MSDSEDSMVTYTAVSSPFDDGSDIGSPGVDGPPIMPEDPYTYIMAAYQEDEILLAEEQPLPAAVSPTADSPGYVPESDSEEDDEDPEEDLADYPADRDDDDDDDDEDEDEEEEEHWIIEGQDTFDIALSQVTQLFLVSTRKHKDEDKEGNKQSRFLPI
ncbi:hypothetical protein Tco_1048702 [Tanacetum coccineum]